jgi:hypothetical protein
MFEIHTFSYKKNMQAIRSFFLSTSKMMQSTTKVGTGTFWDDAKVVIPFFFTLGAGIEFFMIKTGFCNNY